MSVQRECLCAMILLSFSCQTKPVGRKPWSFAAQVGLLTENAGKVCLDIQNPSVEANSRVQMINLSPPQMAAIGRVGAVDGSCISGGSLPRSFQGYNIRLDNGADAPQMPAIGILNYKSDFRKDGDWLSADLDGDGQPEYFRSCTSAEGIHFTIWTGTPLTGKLRWHQYYFLGYDISANCTAEETAPGH